jgi:hypothetical protein
MNTFVIAFASLAFVLGVFAFLAMPIASRLRRVLVSSAFALILVALFFGYSDMLGRPKSTRLEVLRGGMRDARVLGSYLKEGQAVYLWLQLPGVAEPRYYVLPWSEKLAKSLQGAIDQNQKRHGGGIAMKMPFEQGWDKEEPKFYPMPQPKLPDKPGEHAPTFTYQAPEQGT